MTPETLMLYHSPTSPNSRRVRIFLTEKDLKVPLVAVDLRTGEQHSEAYRAINLRRVVPTLVLEDGTAIGEVPAIMRCLDEAFPDKPLLSATHVDKGLIAMWERWAELEGFAAVMEGVRNKIPGLTANDAAPPSSIFVDSRLRFGHQVPRHQFVDALLWPAIHKACQ